MTVMALGRIQAGHRDGQKVYLQASATCVERGLPPEVGSTCRASAASGPEIDRVEPSCDLALPYKVG